MKLNQKELLTLISLFKMFMQDYKAWLQKNKDSKGELIRLYCKLREEQTNI